MCVSSIASIRAARAAAVVALVAVCGVAAPASADISPIVLHIRATSSQGTGQWNALIEAGEFGPDGSYTWTLGAPVLLRNQSGELLGTLTAGNTFIQEDPLVSIGFSVQAGANDTVFQITSALLSFPALNPAEGRASGSITGTDITGNGVTVTGMHAGGTMVTNRYNGMVPAGTNFANLIVGPVSTAESFGSASLSDASPAMGFSPIPGSVTDISMQYFFSLSAGDIASGTGTFVVLPAPGALGALGLVVLAAARRRR